MKTVTIEIPDEVYEIYKERSKVAAQPAEKLMQNDFLNSVGGSIKKTHSIRDRKPVDLGKMNETLSVDNETLFDEMIAHRHGNRD